MATIIQYMNNFFKTVNHTQNAQLKLSNFLESKDNVTQFYARCVKTAHLGFVDNFIADSSFRSDWEIQEIMDLAFNQNIFNYTNEEIDKMQTVLNNTDLRDRFIKSVYDMLTHEKEWGSPEISFLYPAHVYQDVMIKDPEFVKFFGGYDEDFEFAIQDWLGSMDCISMLIVVDEILEFLINGKDNDKSQILKRSMQTISKWNPYLTENKVKNFINEMFIDNPIYSNVFSGDSDLQNVLSFL